MFAQTLLAASACLMTANAHLFISSPKPIPGTAIKDPLNPDGSNFPCHGVALPGSGGQSMAVGAKQQLAFDLGDGQNWAVHGGGSCQLSLTYETDPEKVKQPSAWKVIYSIEGGCPTNSGANLNGAFSGPNGSYSIAVPCDSSESNNYDCVNTFEYSIPEGVKNGQATLAWTWFNNVGNREIYMNCVAVDITGGSDDATMSDFPDLYTANMGALSDYRTTSEDENVKFPDAGKYVTTKTAFTSTYMSSGVVYTISTAKAFPLAVPSLYVSNGVTFSTGAHGSGASPTSSAAGSYGAAPTSYAASSPTSAPATAPTSYAAAPSSYAAVPTLATAASAAPMPSGTSYAGSTNDTSGTCTAGTVPCPVPGELMCINGHTFGICGISHCAVPRAVSLGTTCSNNIVSKRDVVRRRSSRIHRHIPAHIGHKHSF